MQAVVRDPGLCAREERRKGRVLVVDDDAVTRQYLSMMLQGQGYDVLTAPDLSSARSVLGREDFLFALIDLMFPDDDASGFDLIDLIRMQQPRCAVMIMTADQNAETVVEAVRMRVDDYFLKPLKIEELMAAIRKHHLQADDEDADGDDPQSFLTRREKAVLMMFHKGYTYKETARVLGCGVTTIQTHAKHIYRKLGVHSRAEAAHEALRLGLIRP